MTETPNEYMIKIKIQECKKARKGLEAIVRRNGGSILWLTTEKEEVTEVVEVVD